MNEMPDKLLAVDEPTPVTVHNENDRLPFLIVADHAGNLCRVRSVGLVFQRLNSSVTSPGISASLRSAAFWRTGSTPLWCSRITRAWSLTATACPDLRHRSRKSASLLQCLGTLAFRED